MDAKEQLRDDVRTGKVSVDRLIDLIFALQRRVEELEKLLGSPPPTPRLDEPYSMKAEQRRQESLAPKKKPKRKHRKGRRSSAEKIAAAERTEAVYPKDVDPGRCKLSHTRVVWRLENGRAVPVAYEIYRGPKNRYGRIPGAVGRSEFGLEIFVELAFLVYTLGLSFDKAALALKFFQHLSLSKSQVDALLHRLSRHWEGEFETLCTLLANSAVVWADETGWSLKSVWALLSEKARVLLFGVNKDADTLAKVLDPATFGGLVVSDHAAVYGTFTRSQKCWAHLLRKAIKLTLLEPAEAEYREFADRLIGLYRRAVRVKADGRLGDAGRRKRVAELEGELFDLCGPMYALDLPKGAGTRDDYRLLNNELVNLALEEQLFAFVLAEDVTQPNGVVLEVGGTNNESERTLRNPAMARVTGRTNKTLRGARRQSVLTSVLESLRLYLERFTLADVVEEIRSWAEKGRSCFAKLMGELKLSLPAKPVLDRLYPKDGTPALDGSG